MKESFNDIFNINPKISTSISFILGLILIDDLTTPEQNMLGNWIILLGQTIVTNACAQNVIEARVKGGSISINSKKVKSIYNPIIYDINKIKEIIDKTYPNHKIEIDSIINAINELEKKVNKLKED